MALVKCPECGRENVSDSAKACPGCGFQISAHFNKEDTSKISCDSTTTISENSSSTGLSSSESNTKKIVIALCIIGVVIWGIWYFSSRCEWDGCNDQKASSGSYCTYHKSVLNSYTSSYYNSYDYDSRSKYDLKITNVSVYSNSASTYCTGTITNNGDESFEFVKVKGAFKDSSGNTIETGDTYAVGSEGLAPGESTTFKIYCEKNSKVKSCDVTVYDYD